MAFAWSRYVFWLAGLISLGQARKHLWVQRVVASAATSATSTPAAIARPIPISISPSYAWYIRPDIIYRTDAQAISLTQLLREGLDGWSSFTLGVGTPSQNVHVLISTASPWTWAVPPKGCVPGDDNCIMARGGIFDPAKSST